ncbi:hypothetical protein ACER0A_013605 [Haloimpatiens sp. FM7315]|uniref:hypothetical protein n=1 Tax=Haloimpatiens sp. FM7315 TaxID=3298609 RepID=UPI0035A2B609
MEDKDWEQSQFDRIFDDVYENLKAQRELVSTYSIKELESFLETLYVSNGNDWEGRGSVSQIKNNATIAACETFLAEWREEEKNNKK